MCVVERNVLQTSQSVHRKRSVSEQPDVLTKDVPAAVNDGDGDSCLKLDLRGLDQPVTAATPRGVAVAVDSARTLADIPEDILMSARTAAAEELSVGAGTQLVTPRPDVSQVPPSSHADSVSSQSECYSEDFSSAATSNTPGAATQKANETGLLKHSPKNSHESENESVETQDDISEALSADEASTSAVKSARETLRLSTSDEAASPKPSGADDVTVFTSVSHVAGKFYCVMLSAHVEQK